jgi:hypothetical protein
MDAYPDAQIILTTRDVGGWLPSMERAFYKVLNMKRWQLLELFDYVREPLPNPSIPYFPTN